MTAIIVVVAIVVAFAFAPEAASSQWRRGERWQAVGTVAVALLAVVAAGLLFFAEVYFRALGV